MKAVLFAAAFISGAYAQAMVNTPANLIECEPASITWSGGTPPYLLTYVVCYYCVFPAGNSATILQNLGNTNSTSFTWQVNVASGQSVGFAVLDNTGKTGQSAPVPIQAGSSTSCIGQSVSGSAGTTGSSAPTSGSSGSTTTGGSSGSTPTTGSSTGSSAASSGSATSSTTPSNAASSHSAQFGAAGLIGAALVALLA
ncbi:hypothetical protein BT96DRAFT_993242 [Gymnopus androsaceus JB14]|uniref:Uncharacterized protein n=1 Tax=Gymnopus androsaceus JB14 TaxID=1447944 RepID=A0A6A4HQ78_9AGAR|nr:hypothetical protein BT96DRAFT_993242 [Gymnopus androsaceus JB14]